jgi:adenylate cyclase
MTNLLSLLKTFTRIATHPDDDRDMVLKKQLLFGVSVTIIPIGILWGLIHLFFGEYIAAAIPTAYSLISISSIILLRLTDRYETFRTIQLLLILLCPFLFMLAMGGFNNGSVGFIWSVMAPFGAILFYQTHHASRWLLAYLGLLVLCGILQPFLNTETRLPEGFVTSMFVLNIGMVSIITFNLMQNFVNGKNHLVELLRLEREKSERLLLNVLPEEIAPVLKEGKEVIAEHYESASVLFADIVGFTELSEKFSPEEIVVVLNEIFSEFDTLVESYRVEKIRTIGDNYMVASGVPSPRTDHAEVIANLAIDMCDFIENYPALNGHRIDFRVGINSGPLIAGVIGRKKFHYDVWGDTVNIASRMESSGEPGRIQITAVTQQLLYPSFRCTLRGRTPIKGKGEIETWFLEGRNHVQS